MFGVECHDKGEQNSIERNVISKPQTQGALDTTLQIKKAMTTRSGLLLANATVDPKNRKTFLSHSPLVPPKKGFRPAKRDPKH